jgi:hypothetical protein
MGGERGCNRAGHFHCRAIWRCRVTPKSNRTPLNDRRRMFNRISQ